MSVEKVEEGLKALEYPGVASVQIVFNAFRQRPADHFLDVALRHDVGVLARVPLASGLLTGKLTRETAFEATDHRLFNRHGESFDVGETFAGVDYETGLAAVDEMRALVPPGATLAQLALRWILMHPGVTTTIPGAKTPEQARANAAAADLAAARRRDDDPHPRDLRDAGQAPRPPALVGGTAMATATTIRFPGAVVTEREHAVPLDHANPAAGTITVFTREVAAPGRAGPPVPRLPPGRPGLRGDPPDEPAVRLDEAGARRVPRPAARPARDGPLDARRGRDPRGDGRGPGRAT